MDNYAVDLRKELWGKIDRMNEYRSLYVKNPQRDFTRRKKLPLDKMLKLDIQMQAKSLPHELGDFFDYNPNMPTASAFIQQRAKLTDYALPALFSAFTEAHKPRRMANGYRPLPVMGAMSILPAIPMRKIAILNAKMQKVTVWRISTRFRM